MCTNARILVLCNVPYKTLATLAHLHQVDMLTYIQNCSPLSVCLLSLQKVSNTWKEPIQNDSSRTQHYHVVTNTQMVQASCKTVVISCPSMVSARLLEERLWKCLSSVAAAVTDGKVLPGAGSTEFWCAGVIQREAENSLLRGSNVETVILEALANVFYDYYTKVRVNCSLASGQDSITVNVLQKEEHSTAHLATQDREQLASQLGQLISPVTYRVSAPSGNSDHQLHQHNPRFTYLNGASRAESLEGQFSQSFSTHPFFIEKPAQKSLHLTKQYKPPLHVDCANSDNYHSKISAWETALAVVSVLVNVDTFIVTGVKAEQAVL
ncbi:unnamed protein product [Lymnaea stagnalis]|uniref:Uncharacterized protein n=1 Tax=Lymnaea stagnalis TaxID=6523 RepID=A0AAV2I090_LYMST